jgi:hypothetical protein
MGTNVKFNCGTAGIIPRGCGGGVNIVNQWIRLLLQQRRRLRVAEKVGGRNVGVVSSNAYGLVQY